MKKIRKEIFFNNIGLTCNFAEAFIATAHYQHRVRISCHFLLQNTFQDRPSEIPHFYFVQVPNRYEVK